MSIPKDNSHSDLLRNFGEANSFADYSGMTSNSTGCEIRLRVEGIAYDLISSNHKVGGKLSVTQTTAKCLLKTLTAVALQLEDTSNQPMVNLPPDARSRSLMLHEMHSRIVST